MSTLSPELPTVETFVFPLPNSTPSLDQTNNPLLNQALTEQFIGLPPVGKYDYGQDLHLLGIVTTGQWRELRGHKAVSIQEAHDQLRFMSDYLHVPSNDQPRLVEQVEALIGNANEQNLPEAMGYAHEIASNAAEAIGATQATIDQLNAQMSRGKSPNIQARTQVKILEGQLERLKREARSLVTSITKAYEPVSLELERKLDEQVKIDPRIGSLLFLAAMLGVPIQSVMASAQALSNGAVADNHAWPTDPSLTSQSGDSGIQLVSHLPNSSAILPPELNPTHAPELQVQPGGEGVEPGPVVTNRPGNIRPRPSTEEAFPSDVVFPDQVEIIRVKFNGQMVNNTDPVWYEVRFVDRGIEKIGYMSASLGFSFPEGITPEQLQEQWARYYYDQLLFSENESPIDSAHSTVESSLVQNQGGSYFDMSKVSSIEASVLYNLFQQRRNSMQYLNDTLLEGLASVSEISLVEEDLDRNTTNVRGAFVLHSIDPSGNHVVYWPTQSTGLHTLRPDEFLGVTGLTPLTIPEGGTPVVRLSSNGNVELTVSFQGYQLLSYDPNIQNWRVSQRLVNNNELEDVVNLLSEQINQRLIDFAQFKDLLPIQLSEVIRESAQFPESPQWATSTESYQVYFSQGYLDQARRAEIGINNQTSFDTAYLRAIEYVFQSMNDEADRTGAAHIDPNGIINFKQYYRNPSGGVLSDGVSTAELSGEISHIVQWVTTTDELVEIRNTLQALGLEFMQIYVPVGNQNLFFGVLMFDSQGQMILINKEYSGYVPPDTPRWIKTIDEIASDATGFMMAAISNQAAYADLGRTVHRSNATGAFYDYLKANNAITIR